MNPDAFPSRRSVLAGAALSSAALPVQATTGSVALAPSSPMLAQVSADLQRYVAFGTKTSGGEGDLAAGAWMEAAARHAGYTVQRQPFDAPAFTIHQATLSTGDTTAQLMPQAVVVPTAAEGVMGPLVLRGPWLGPETRCDGAIAIVELPYRRWSSLIGEPRTLVEASFAAGAAAVVLVTTGPTGEAIGLNAPAAGPLFDRPVAVLAPKDAAPFLRAASRGEHGRCTVTGEGGRRSSFNLVARMRPGRGRGLVVSTPRSGWTAGGGERGGGVAAWLALLRWAPIALPGVDLTFLATSGHEYENQGGELLLASSLAPDPAATALWVHLGANVAARDWNALAHLTPQDGADSQRILMTTPQLTSAARDAFLGQPGLQTVRTASPGASAGELTGILAKGYRAVAGVFGAHPFHHVASDDLEKTEVDATLQAVTSFKTLINTHYKAS